MDKWIKDFFSFCCCNEGGRSGFTKPTVKEELCKLICEGVACEGKCKKTRSYRNIFPEDEIIGWGSDETWGSSDDVVKPSRRGEIYHINR